MDTLQRIISAIFVLLWLSGVNADELFDSYSVGSIVGDNVARGARGYVGVNIAAGDANLQSNAAAIALGGQGGAGLSASALRQRVDGVRIIAPVVAVSSIRDNAFSEARGVLSINQASGVANAQANSVAIAFGVATEVTVEADLAQYVAGSLQLTPDVQRRREASVADTAFSGARGIVQLNQSAGAANATSNNFMLRIQSGVLP